MKTEQSLRKTPVEPLAFLPATPLTGTPTGIAAGIGARLVRREPGFVRAGVFADLTPSVYAALVLCWMAFMSIFILTGALVGLKDALFYSTAAFATTGSADMAVKPAWRLLASFEGVNGFILIGWSTAYLVTASTRFGPFHRGEHF